MSACLWVCTQVFSQSLVTTSTNCGDMKELVTVNVWSGKRDQNCVFKEKPGFNLAYVLEGAKLIIVETWGGGGGGQRGHI